MAREDYSTIMIKNETKRMMDDFKKESGKSLWFIMHEAIKEYVSKYSKVKEN